MNAHPPVWRRLGWRLQLSFLLLTALGILSSGFLQYRAQAQLLQQSLGSLLLNIARTGALLVDGDVHQTVVAAGRSDSPEYAKLRQALLKIQETNRLGDAVYTLTDVEGDQARFGVISNGQTVLGSEYRLALEIQPTLVAVLRDGIAAYTEPYVNEHGRWITAFAPVKNSAGQTVAALDVDYRADVYFGELAAARRRLYLFSLAGAVVALIAGAVLARQITRPLSQLSALARNIVEGHLSSRVRVQARDEIGMLGNVLHLMVERLDVSHRSMVDVLVRALEARGEAPGSLQRLAVASLALGDRLQLSPPQREALEMGALLHDVGEIRVSESVLQAAGPWTSGEREIAAKHPGWGVEILERVPLLTPALEVVEAHHERWDGGGYPQGLRGEEIPVTARIFAVVDALDAMTHARPHRPGRALEEALAIIRVEAGRQFDPRVVEVALQMSAVEWTALLGLPRLAEPSVTATTG
jgi:methyl-accepting chemotaxis protein